MRNKPFFLLLAGITLFLVLKTGAYANGCPQEDLEASAQQFVAQYYEDLKAGDKSTIEQYFLERPDKETLDLLEQAGRTVFEKPLDDEEVDWMIGPGKQVAEALEIEFFDEMSIISKKPLIVEVAVLENFKRFSYEMLFILKNITNCTWKIIEKTMPGLP